MIAKSILEAPAVDPQVSTIGPIGSGLFGPISVTGDAGSAAHVDGELIVEFEYSDSTAVTTIIDQNNNTVFSGGDVSTTRDGAYISYAVVFQLSNYPVYVGEDLRAVVAGETSSTDVQIVAHTEPAVGPTIDFTEPGGSNPTDNSSPLAIDLLSNATSRDGGALSVADLSVEYRITHVDGSEVDGTLTADQYSLDDTGHFGFDPATFDQLNAGDVADVFAVYDVVDSISTEAAVDEAIFTINGASELVYGSGNLAGTAFDDQIFGDSDPVTHARVGATDDAVVAGAGNDMVVGYDGNDKIYGNQGNDTIFGNVGDDYLNGGKGNDLLNGGKGSDTLIGGVGDDTLIGGEGADMLTGNAGADTFKFNVVKDSTPAAYDVITDFEAGIDKIDIRALHTSASDSFQIVTTGGNTFIDVDLGGNGSIDVVIEALGAGVVTASDVVFGTAPMASNAPSATSAAVQAHAVGVFTHDATYDHVQAAMMNDHLMMA